MSNFLAIATVTATLSQLLHEAAREVVPGVSVSTGRPESVDDGSSGPRINLYLYQVMPNIAWRNADLPTRRTDGTLVQRPQVALDLHYLLTFYGNENALEPQRLLGSTASKLHTEPMLTQARIRGTIRAATDMDPDHYLGNSDLAEQVETVKFSPLPLNLEELSKLWSVFFQTPYTLSTAYRGSVVLVEGNGTPRQALPVRTPRISGGIWRRPVVERVLSQAGRDQPIVAGSTLLIQGRGLRGDVTRVRVGEVEATPAIEDVSDRQIRLPVPDSLRAGVRGVQAVHSGGVESNVVPFVLRPTVVGVRVADVEAGSDASLSAEVALEIAPRIGKAQRVVLLLNELASDGPAAYSFVAPQRDAEADAIAIPVGGVKAGEYLVRVQVDGAESPLAADANPESPTFDRYVEPKVTITACLSNCLRSADIRLSSETQGVRGQVAVEDENGRPVTSAVVSATWTLPDGATRDQTRGTRSDGTLARRFSVSDGEGVYTLTITDIAKDGYTFDPDHSVLSESMTREPTHGSG